LPGTVGPGRTAAGFLAPLYGLLLLVEVNFPRASPGKVGLILKKLQADTVTGDNNIATLLEALRSDDAPWAWTALLDQYSPVILHAVRRCIWDADRASDCFVFVCERLSERGFRRLLQFRLNTGCTFETWLRVVVRNLCLDWHRKQSGRWRAFRSLTRLPVLAMEVYRLRYEEGLSAQEALFNIQAAQPEVTRAAFEDADAQLREALNSRQNWILSARLAASEDPAAVAPGLDDALAHDVPDWRPSPEAEAMSREQRTRTARAVARLDAQDRVLLQLRYGQDLTLSQIARFASLRDAQSADRRIRAVLEKLRRQLK
jgi:RNA polymerase sigma factor (sigma-70 family)